MANLMRREPNAGRSIARQRGGLFDPFDLMRQWIGYDPFEGMSGVERGVERYMVPFDVKETKDSWIFKADVPGVKEEDLDVSVSGNLLTVSGKRETESTRDDEQWHGYERNYGSFTRSFTLPENADTEHLKAELYAGELKLVVPKRPELMPRKIPVEAKPGIEGQATAKKDVPVKH